MFLLVRPAAAVSGEAKAALRKPIRALPAPFRTDAQAAGRGYPDRPGRLGRLVDKDDIWYLIAGTERGQCTFRVDRIGEPVVTEETFERPADFDLEPAWHRVVAEVEEQRSRTWATLLIAERFVCGLRGHFGRHCETVAYGRARLRVGAPTPLGRCPAGARPWRFSTRLRCEPSRPGSAPNWPPGTPGRPRDAARPAGHP